MKVVTWSENRVLKNDLFQNKFDNFFWSSKSNCKPKFGKILFRFGEKLEFIGFRKQISPLATLSGTIAVSVTVRSGFKELDTEELEVLAGKAGNVI